MVSRLKEAALGRRKEAVGEGRKGAQGGGEKGATVSGGTRHLLSQPTSRTGVSISHHGPLSLSSMLFPQPQTTQFHR